MIKQKSTLYEYAQKNALTIEQVEEFYEIEKQLASQLRNSTRKERQHLYTAVYDELFKRVSYHPQLTKKVTPDIAARMVARSMQFLSRFLHPQTTFLEVGPGDCSVSLEVAKHVEKVYAVDVSNEITKNLNAPANFELAISDGISIPVPNNSIDVVYSNQLMEHLHPEDAIDQLQNIYQALAPGGVYICVTPNRLSGPHDVSLCFDEVATGFHLKEYLVSEMYNLFLEAGFSQVSLYKSYRQISVKIPLFPLTVFLLKLGEEITMRLPFSLRRSVANLLIVFREMTVVGIK